MKKVQKIKSDLKALQDEILSALEVIESNDGYQSDTSNNLGLQIKETESLLQRCQSVVKESAERPVVRIIHHLACSGGTLVSKCISALPNAFLLSELHPTTTLHQGGGKPKFLPADITTQARYANIPNIEDLSWNLFLSNIKIVHEHLRHLSGDLILRDHTHSDYCVGEDFVQKSTIASRLEKEFELLRVVTLRDPIDSYISLVKNNWVHFSPRTFENYCERVWAFLSEYEDAQVFKYEDFVLNPLQIMADISKALRLQYDENFAEIFDIFKVTGDSGRSGNVISTRERRALTEEEEQEFKQSKSYKLICERFAYCSL